LEESALNLEVASLVSSLLAHKDCAVEVLPEFSSRLARYQADVLISIHAGGCSQSDLAGFKVARLAGSRLPEEDNRVVSCLVQAYGEASGLAYLDGAVTGDMTDYHTFSEIAPTTPGAVIEVGSMSSDHRLLIERSEIVAQGIAQGVICFVEGE
jgi:N-acetylmuramoyl-L-alanine amidase